MDWEGIVDGLEVLHCLSVAVVHNLVPYTKIYKCTNPFICDGFRLKFSSFIPKFLAKCLNKFQDNDKVIYKADSTEFKINARK
jgi:hypothetical protein